MVPEILILLSSPLFLLIWPLSDLHLRHGFRSDPTTTHHQSAQATADAIASVLTARMASISLPVYDWDSQDAYHSFSIFCCTLKKWLLLNCIPPDSEDHLRYVFAALGTKSLEMHAQWMPTSSEEEQKATKVKASAFLDPIQQGMTHDVNTHVHLGELKRDCSQAGRGPPRSHQTYQDTDGPLRDDQWWASRAWTASLYCLCIPPRGKAPWKTYGQAIQDTLQWAGWHCCEPLCHPTHQGTSLPQLQTCGHNLRGQKVDSPHQPQQPWSHTICTLLGLSNCTQQHPAGKANCPACDSHCSKCNKMGHWGPKCCGGKPLQPRNAPPPGSQ